VRQCRRRLLQPSQQLDAAQRAGQVDALARKMRPRIERARVREVARRPRAHERFDAVARA